MQSENKVTRNIFNRIAALIIWLIGIQFTITIIISLIVLERFGSGGKSYYEAGYIIAGNASPAATTIAFLAILVLSPFGLLYGTQKYRKPNK